MNDPMDFECQERIRIKERPEDFIVEEILEVSHVKNDNLVFTLKKTNWDTLMAIKVMARKLGVSQKRFGFAGLKDRRAVTSQKISVYGVAEERVAALRIPRLEISEIERGDRIRVGDLSGNRFRITVKNVGGEGRIDWVKKGFPNYFGIQRFGEVRPITHLVGKLMLEKKLEEAAATFIAMPVEGEKYFHARKRLYEDRNYALAKQYYPKSLRYERAMIENMEGGALSAFKALPKRLNTLFIHALQALLFNRILARRCEEVPPYVAELDDVVVSRHLGHEAYMNVQSYNVDRINSMIPEVLPVAPIVGYKTRLHGRMKKITEEVLEEEGLKYEDFSMPHFPSLSSRGTWREMLGVVRDFSHELNEKTLTLSFFLPKGCYATTMLDYLFDRNPFM